VLYSIKDLKTRSIAFAPDGRLMVVLQGESQDGNGEVKGRAWICSGPLSSDM
jgi:hypothetical protein